MNLEASIEAVLFYKTEPIKKTALAELFAVSIIEVEQALQTLATTLSVRGVRITHTDEVVQMVTAPEFAEVIEQIRKDELRGDIGKAGAETLAIILYRGPIARIELDRIRGVNTTFVLRNLLMRGLIERRPHPTDSRSFLYAITPLLLNHLGIEKREALPDFGQIIDAIEAFEKENNDSIPETNQLVSS